MKHHETRALREKRSELVELNRRTLLKINDDTPALQARELEAEWDKRDAEIATISRQLDRFEKQLEVELEESQPLHRRASGRGGGREDPRLDAELGKFSLTRAICSQVPDLA